MITYRVTKSTEVGVVLVEKVGTYTNMDDAKVALMDVILEAFPEGCTTEVTPDADYPGAVDCFAYSATKSLVVSIDILGA